MNKVIVFFLLLITSFEVISQPGTEIYLYDLKIKRGKVTAGNPRNISNHKGYDNQPFFHPDKPVLYFVSANEGGRTDIVAYNYHSNKANNFTQTHDREYSPTITPDKQFISCILQRDSGAQDLVKYPVEGGEPIILISDLTVGYHAWGNENKVAVFALPQPFKLHVLDLKTKANTVVAEQIGRSLHKIPGQEAISYIQKVNDSEWVINRLNMETMQTTAITRSLPGAGEHYMTWTPDGKMLMSDEKKIFFFEPAKSTSWQEVEITSALQLTSVTRLAVSPDGKTLAVVMSEQ
jgi:Tol biopolymer transport system component